MLAERLLPAQSALNQGMPAPALPRPILGPWRKIGYNLVQIASRRPDMADPCSAGVQTYPDQQGTVLPDDRPSHAARYLLVKPLWRIETLRVGPEKL